MPVARPDLADIEQAIRSALASGRSGIMDVAQITSTSTSTLQRTLAKEGVCFSGLRRKVQLRIALRLLTSGKSLRFAASEVALTPDHLSVIIKEETGLCPRQILRAAELGGRVSRWRRQGPPSYGSPLYHRRRREWLQIDAELIRLLADLNASHPLAEWAKALLVAIDRPDYRRQPYRDDLRDRRELERKRWKLRLREYLDRSLDVEAA